MKAAELRRVKHKLRMMLKERIEQNQRARDKALAQDDTTKAAFFRVRAVVIEELVKDIEALTTKSFDGLM
jgi:hypothetical protein